MEKFQSELRLDSDDQRLVEAFQWAKGQALAYVFTGDPVGDWYEAALPGRAAFCMRDVAHQANGAHALGLARFNRNMLLRFAENISFERDWCTFWEIDRRNLPCPADYRDDHHFWYNLPANFDVLDCCLRQYLWSGDRTYLDHPALRYFYTKSANEYVRLWDKDQDGLMEHYAEYGHRGIASYNEDISPIYVGGDQAAAQYGGYRAFTALMEMDRNFPEAAAFREKARALKDNFNTAWWDGKTGQYFGFYNQDHSYTLDPHRINTVIALYFGLLEDGSKTESSLDDLIQFRTRSNIETRTYLPEIFYRYGRVQTAYDELLELCHPGMLRREYPENSYAMVGAIASGMMGIAPDARERLVSTCPRLAAGTGWVELSELPVFDCRLAVRHTGNTATTLNHLGGTPLFWQAGFPGRWKTLRVDGVEQPAQRRQGENRQEVSFVYLRVEAGERHTVEVASS